MEVLLVDPSGFLRHEMSRSLHQAGYRTIPAATLPEALALFSEQRHQIVVSDSCSPDRIGIQFCQTIRASNRRRYTYFILLTEHSNQMSSQEVVESGADDFLAKPFETDELVMRVNTARRIIGLQAREMTIFVLAKLAESRDPETGAHLERVRAYCRTLAARLKDSGLFTDLIDDEFIGLIYDASPLHDIGKVAIPDAILLKPGQLANHEFEIMKTHALRGAETLTAAIREFPHADFLPMARDIALHHHERYDGTGYPAGLRGDAIPLAARIVALADCYDALTFKRVYKLPSTHEVARSIITEESGKHFDPRIVSAFLQSEQEFINIRRQFGNRREIAPNSLKPADAGESFPATAVLS